jgi:uncharacterized protein (TIGR03435 family)
MTPLKRCDVRRWLLAGAIAIAAAGIVSAQTRPEFEVASVKPNKSGPRPTFDSPYVFSPSGRFMATDVTLTELIIVAYQTRRIQMQGGPGWLDVNRFDVAAKADDVAGPIKGEQFRAMIQTMLEDRFKLALHRETKELSAYALVVEKNGHKLQKAKDDEQPLFAPGKLGQMAFRKMPVVALVNTVSNILQTPVVDRTGLEGLFDYTLEPAPPDPNQMRAPGAAAGSPATAYNFGDAVVAAMQDQLGLRLEKQKAPLEIIVIDHAEPPTEN